MWRPLARLPTGKPSEIKAPGPIAGEATAPAPRPYKGRGGVACVGRTTCTVAWRDKVILVDDYRKIDCLDHRLGVENDKICHFRHPNGDHGRRLALARSPCSAISAATVFWLTRHPISVRSAVILGAP